MKGFRLFLVVVSGCLLSSCAGGPWGKSASDQSGVPVSACPTGADTILTCLADHQKMSRKEFKAAHKMASEKITSGQDVDRLRLICLNLHVNASDKQFKNGMETLVAYIKDHPTEAGTLQGLHDLVQRLDKERISKRVQGTKILDEKEELGSENKELQERNVQLEKNILQDQERIRELQNQIEQLKNIENIIKNRER